jgi:hypothetical protein
MKQSSLGRQSDDGARKATERRIPTIPVSITFFCGFRSFFAALAVFLLVHVLQL